MFPKQFVTVLLLALCLIATASAAPAPANSTDTQLSPEAIVRDNVRKTIDKEIGKASRTFNLSKTAVIAIGVSCSFAVLLLLCCLVCCCCGCCTCFK